MNQFWRGLGLFVLCILMAGFGICGACGLFLSFNLNRNAAVDAEILGLGLTGLAIAAFLFWLVRWIMKKGK